MLLLEAIMLYPVVFLFGINGDFFRWIFILWIYEVFLKAKIGDGTLQCLAAICCVQIMQLFCVCRFVAFWGSNNLRVHSLAWT